eukprot:scaffold2666_cov562-Prasinococcus_capsulatus_cf.AAC.8
MGRMYCPYHLTSAHIFCHVHIGPTSAKQSSYLQPGKYARVPGPPIQRLYFRFWHQMISVYNYFNTQVPLEPSPSASPRPTGAAPHAAREGPRSAARRRRGHRKSRGPPSGRRSAASAGSRAASLAPVDDARMDAWPVGRALMVS